MSDYTADRTKVPGVDISFGVIRSTHGGKAVTARSAVERRLMPNANGPLCHRQELLLPPGAADMLLDLELLLACHEKQLIPDQRDLITIFTMRFGRGAALHEQWELARGFVRERMVIAEQLAVVLVQHQPGFCGYRNGKAHVHAMALARRLENSHFVGFSPLIDDGAKAKLGAAWKDWLATHA